MPKPLFKPPTQLVKEWPEVFEDLYMNTMPVAYIDLLRLEFNDGRVWEINIDDQLKSADADSVADKILSIFQEYREEIKKVDFKMDIERLKKDIKNSTDTLF
jgi:hypothetical protein